MKKNLFVFFILTGLLFNVFSAHALPSGVSSKVCSVTTKVCVSNVTNKLTAKDEELLQACKNCCTITPTIAGTKGCIPRCQKSCAAAYKKEIAKLNNHGKM